MSQGINIGGTYWSNDLERVLVVAKAFVSHGVQWFDTVDAAGRRGTFDASRLVARHPGTGERADNVAFPVIFPAWRPVVDDTELHDIFGAVSEAFDYVESAGVIRRQTSD